MALVLADRVKETTTTAGTGTINLAGAEPSFRTFVAGVGAGNTTYYTIVDGNAWEVGLGTVTDAAPDTLSRTLIASSTGSLLNLSGGLCNVFATYPGARSVYTDNSGDTTLAGNLTATTFSGDGTSLTGTAASLTAGNATNVALGGVTGLGTGVATALALPITAAASTVLDDATVGNMRTTLGALGEADFTAVGQILIGQDSGDAVAVSSPLGGAQIINGKIALSVGASALTVALKGLDGNDPSAANPVFIRVPQNTAGVLDGTYAIRKVTAALSLTISSGSTLGHTSAVACPVYFYLIDVSGTPILGASTKFFGSPCVVSPTAEGGAGGADSATTMYAASNQTNMPACVIGRWKSTQTTAGTWAAVTGEQQLYPFPFKKPTTQVFTSTGANTYTKPWDMLWARVTATAAGGGGGGAAATTAAQIAAAGGGSGGGTGIKNLDASSIGGTETATVGAGGTAGAVGANVGGTGGTTSFGSHITATGGSGGAGGTATVNYVSGNGQMGGSSSGGDYNFRGGGSGYGHGVVSLSQALAGRGGDSYFGGGAREFSGGTNAGTAGVDYGGGASGGVNAPSESAVAGGAGGNGIIIVEEHYQ